jgi:hypothetical protein
MRVNCRAIALTEYPLESNYTSENQVMIEINLEYTMQNPILILLS